MRERTSGGSGPLVITMFFTVPGALLFISCLSWIGFESVSAGARDSGFLWMLFSLVLLLILFVIAIPAIIVGAIVDLAFEGGMASITLPGLEASPKDGMISMGVYAVAYAIVPWAVLYLSRALSGVSIPSPTTIAAYVIALFSNKNAETGSWDEDAPLSNREREKEKTRVELATELEDLINENRRTEARIRARNGED